MSRLVNIRTWTDNTADAFYTLNLHVIDLLRVLSATTRLRQMQSVD